MYPNTSLFIAIGQVAIVILVLFSYPLQVHPCRNCLDKVFHATASIAEDPKLVTAAIDEDGEEDETDEHVALEMTPFKHTALTVAIIVAGFTTAYFVDDLKLGPYLPNLLLHFPRPNRRVSSFLCRFYGLDHYIIHPSWAILLEGEELLLPCAKRGLMTPCALTTQLFRNEPGHSKGMILASALLAIYGAIIFVFWSARSFLTWRIPTADKITDYLQSQLQYLAGYSRGC
jgi:hypothetical protein